ncbi:MAG: RCC1 repeat- and reductase domain-containing protein [Planctomycetes bacterium]|nr:RCC1 repeat- and reductase domain-containing protein [Planctomycetota bacterium]
MNKKVKSFMWAVKNFIISVIVLFNILFGTICCASNAPSTTPTEQSNLTFVVTPVVRAGYKHTVALKSDGAVWTWGSNFDGELGDGTNTQRTTPVQVRGNEKTNYLTNIVAVAAGDSHAVALKSDGTVWTWGNNETGQLGDGTFTSRNIPVQVKDNSGADYLKDVVAIAACKKHTAALKKDGTIWAWGKKTSIQLGSNSDLNSLFPVQVKNFTENLQDIIAIAADAEHTVTLEKAYFMSLAWERADYGPFEKNLPSDGPSPTEAYYLDNVIAVAEGTAHTVALKNDGTVWAWGKRLGNGDYYDKDFPVQIKSGFSDNSYFTNVITICAGGFHSVILTNDGTVWTWGWNLYGQLGDGSILDKSFPIQVKELKTMIAIGAGAAHTVAVKKDGTVWAWGNNDAGQIGDGTVNKQLTPVQVKNINLLH